MLMRYVENNFTTAFYNTIGVDFVSSVFIIENEEHRDRWEEGQDASGTFLNDFSGILPAKTGLGQLLPLTTSTTKFNFRGAHGIILVYDVTDR